MTKKGPLIQKMLEEGHNYPHIMRELGVAGSTIAYHAKKLNMRKFTFSRTTHNWNDIQKTYDTEEYTLSDIVEMYSLDWSTLHDAKLRGSFVVREQNSTQRRKMTQKRNARLASEGKSFESSNATPIEKLFIENSPVTTTTIRKRVKSEGLLPYRCSIEECVLHVDTPTWIGVPINLHLDHINGTRNDHRLSNLRWLCPNCHSQTTTYCGRNIVLVRATEVESV